jgi:hypothetical protein
VVHAKVNAEDCAVPGRCLLRRVGLHLGLCAEMKKPLAILVMEFCARHFVVIVVEIPTVRCVPVCIGQDVLNFDASIYSRQRHILVVECGAPLVVDDSRLREMRFPCVFALFPATDDTLYGVGGLVASVLDKICVQLCPVAYLVVGFLLQLCLARCLVVALPSVVNDVVSGTQKLSNCFAEKYGVGTVNVEFDRDSAPHLHTSDVWLVVY